MKSEFDAEPIEGLPEALPAGEQILWQGRPRFLGLAAHAFRTRILAIYFALLLAWSLIANLRDGASAIDTVASLGWMATLAATALGTLGLLAWASARATVYTITSRRLVLRYGIALPMALNLPFSRISRAALRLNGDGTGDIALEMRPEDKVAYLVLWPHARPGRYARPQPMLRAVPQAARVARLLAEAMQAAEQAVPSVTTIAVVPARAAPSGDGARQHTPAVVAAE